MSNLSVPPININNIPIDVYSIHHVLASVNLTGAQKLNFLKRHSDEVKGIMEIELGTEEFDQIMSCRPLILFRPVKNFFTKKGDRLLLAKTLEIPPNELDDFVKKATHALPNPDELALYSKGQLDAIKTYIFRHGSKEQVIKFMDYELSHSKNLRRSLYQTLQYTTGGVADYFSRPIHRMDNKTFIGLFEVVVRNIEKAKTSGSLSEEDALRISKACLARLYHLQENSKLKNSVKTKAEIEDKIKNK